jgi:hypothetical protein
VLMVVLAAAVLVVLAWLPSAAHAFGCTDSWSAKGSGSWFTASNWSEHRVPTSTDEVCITENPGASYTVEMLGTGSVTVKSLTIGASEHTQTLEVASSNSVNADLTTSSGIANGAHGAIVLTNSETAGNNVTIAGPITNAGTVTSEKAVGGQRSLQGALTNTGTLAINALTSFNSSKAVLSNEGVIDIATGVALTGTVETTVANGAGGKIVAAGSGLVEMESGTTFNEAGTTSGTKPVVLRDAALIYSGGGESLIEQLGESSTLSGNIGSKQSLVLASYNSENVKSTASASFTNAGSITLTNTETAGNSASLVITSPAVLTNEGTITTEKVNGGQRNLEGNITNGSKGTLAINTLTSFNSSKAVLSNEGAIDIATGVALTGTVETTVANGAGGKIVAAGSGLVEMESGTTFNEAGTTSGTKPVVLRDAALVYSGGGESLIEQLGEASTLSGSIGSKQSLVLASYNSENVKSTASVSFTNAGSITLTNTETAGNSASLVITSPAVLTNEGTITTEKAIGGQRNLEGSITNTSKGTLAINAPSTFSTTKAALLNEGAINIAAGVSLQVNNEASVTNAAGSIVVGENGALELEPATKFTEGAGTTAGRVALRDANLLYSGTGTSMIFQLGESSTLSGNIGPKQSLVLESYNSENVRTTAAASFTNEGSITLTNSETAGNSATLAISAGVLTNDGTITTEKAIGGQRNLNGNITNGSKGTLAINAPTLFNVSGAALINEGAIDIALGVTLSASNGETISNESGGSITTTGTGALVQSNGTFNEGLGKTTTAKSSEPVILDDGTLNYTNKGASKIAVRGAINLTGAVNKGQTLDVESDNSQNAEVTSGGFINSGTIVLTNAESAGNSVRLKLGGATLQNKGKLEALYPNGGTRTIEGNLVNEKTLTLGNGKGSPLQVDGKFTQTSKGTLTITIEGASTQFGKLSATEAVSIEGKLSLKQKKFKATAGETFGIISGASRTGEFASIKGNAVKGGSLHYIPHYTATAVNLIVE